MRSICPNSCRLLSGAYQNCESCQSSPNSFRNSSTLIIFSGSACAVQPSVSRSLSRPIASVPHTFLCQFRAKGVSIRVLFVKVPPAERGHTHRLHLFLLRGDESFVRFFLQFLELPFCLCLFVVKAREGGEGRRVELERRRVGASRRGRRRTGGGHGRRGYLLACVYALANSSTGSSVGEGEASADSFSSFLRCFRAMFAFSRRHTRDGSSRSSKAGQWMAGSHSS